MGASAVAMLSIVWLALNGSLKVGQSAEETQIILWIIGGATIILLFTILIFHSLTVRIDPEWIVVSFGIGVVSKKFKLSEIIGCKTVRNSWFWGYGVHKIPRGWLYNISGPDAVQLALKDQDRIIRIGTDEPDALAAAITERISSFR